MVPTCIMWLVWQEHNTCTFENIERPLDLFKGVRSLWTTFFFIAQQLTGCGQWCFIFLGSNGLYQRGLSIYSLHGRDPLESIEIQPSGRLCHIASCGVCGVNGLLEVLRDVNSLSQMLKPSSFIPCQTGVSFRNDRALQFESLILLHPEYTPGVLGFFFFK